MNYNYVHNYYKSNITTNEQLLFINNRYTCCEITGNKRPLNQAEKKIKLPNLPISRSRSRPTTRSEVPNRIYTRTAL